MKAIRTTALILTIIMITAGWSACTKNNLTSVPSSAVETPDTVALYPDYREVAIPPNIAPLNFQLTQSTREARAHLKGSLDGMEFTIKADEEGTFIFPESEWCALLSANRGGAILYTIYVSKEEGKWNKYRSFTQHVAMEPIDKCLSYRLIEPGYDIYRQLGIYQRDLESYEQKPIYINNRRYDSDDNHCVNCHTYQNYESKRMLFHIRHTYGGTLFIDDDKYKKIGLKTDSTIGAGVYPAWHPKLNALIFSVNKTGQMFFTDSNAKIEVVDTESDMIYYNVEKNEVFSLGRTPNVFETFPTWNPEGTKLYYCAAELPNDTAFLNRIPANYDKLHYNLMSRSFDPKTQRFGQPEVVINAAKDTLSITLPRVSPDGKYLLFTIGQFGQFHIWHKKSDLGLLDLTTGVVSAPEIINSPDVESWHSWSSNGRWITFSSRRDDGSFTRPYFAYFDSAGNMHKPFLLPQRDPVQNKMLTLSYNLPTLTQEAIPYDLEEMTQQVRSLEAAPALFKGNK